MLHHRRGLSAGAALVATDDAVLQAAAPAHSATLPPHHLRCATTD